MKNLMFLSFALLIGAFLIGCSKEEKKPIVKSTEKVGESNNPAARNVQCYGRYDAGPVDCGATSGICCLKEIIVTPVMFSELEDAVVNSTTYEFFNEYYSYFEEEELDLVTLELLAGGTYITSLRDKNGDICYYDVYESNGSPNEAVSVLVLNVQE